MKLHKNRPGSLEMTTGNPLEINLSLRDINECVNLDCALRKKERELRTVQCQEKFR
jgi:hypothetical protein